MSAPVKPPAVDDVQAFWGSPPKGRSPRCAYWVEQIEKGWIRNRRIGGMGYFEAAEWFGVYLWEYLNVLSPMMREREERPTP